MNEALQILHLGVEGSLLTLCVGVLVVCFRIYNVLKDYPPHRHENGRVAYPRDFQPPVVEELR